ncbi:MAG: DUF1345 domain-containing protein [Synechococcales cyanobacterium M58_A2018_015]|nr:DUF1345 domain-containing protein [Synechococcales cyanobacterium M58_A2018_015]
MKSLPHRSTGNSTDTESSAESSHPLARHRSSWWTVVSGGLALGHSLLSHLDSKTRLGLSLMAGMTCFLLLPDQLHLDIRILAGWITGVLCFLMLVILMLSRITPQKTCYRAQRQEAQHSVVFLLTVLTSCTSIFAIALMQANNQGLSAEVVFLEMVLSLVAVIGSWFLTHTLFALHYATCFYRRDFTQEVGFAGGLDFPNTPLPDYWDFLYFSFTLGMTAQTSDVAIPGAGLRRLAIAHGIVSFFFYIVIIASGVGVASELI